MTTRQRRDIKRRLFARATSILLTSVRQAKKPNTRKKGWRKYRVENPSTKEGSRKKSLRGKKKHVRGSSGIVGLKHQKNLKSRGRGGS